jgi:hypothetical protein
MAAALSRHGDYPMVKAGMLGSPSSASAAPNLLSAPVARRLIDYSLDVGCRRRVLTVLCPDDVERVAEQEIKTVNMTL